MGSDGVDGKGGLIFIGDCWAGISLEGAQPGLGGEWMGRVYFVGRVLSRISPIGSDS